jgi:hypothetical protein
MIPPHKEDRITPKLPALHFYQLSLPVPKPPSGAFDTNDPKRTYRACSRC